jgi:hypothetical protein
MLSRPLKKLYVPRNYMSHSGYGAVQSKAGGQRAGSSSVEGLLGRSARLAYLTIPKEFRDLNKYRKHTTLAGLLPEID